MKSNLNSIPTVAPKKVKKQEASDALKELRTKLYALQNLFYAEKKHALLIILQGMDTAGKDSTIRHVFSCVNPQGCSVKSFKAPTAEEQLHDFLWRVYPHLPEKGMIQIFNRSHYEDILVPVVHGTISKDEANERHQIINAFEKHLQRNGTIILKFYLHISKKEQAKRLDDRVNDPEKRWKYDANDIKEAHRWNDYMDVYQNMIDNATKSNPWMIVPADEKWYRNYIIADTIVKTLEQLKMKFPK